LPGVYLVIEEEIFATAPEGATLRRETFKTLEILLQDGGVSVLPSREELELTRGNPVLTIAATSTQEGQTVFCGIAVQLMESVQLVRLSETTCSAVTWLQIGKFHLPAQEFWQGLGQAMHILVALFVEDYQIVNAPPAP